MIDIFWLFALFTICVFLLSNVGAVYHNFIRLSALSNEAWRSIDVQLKRRHDLIPDFVEIVQQYDIREQSVLENVSRMRSLSMQAVGIEDKIIAEGNLVGALRKLCVVAEQYSQLKINEKFLELQKDFASIEREIQPARYYYNKIVREYNVCVTIFPSSVVASMMGMHKKPYYEVSSLENQNQNIYIPF